MEPAWKTKGADSSLHIPTLAETHTCLESVTYEQGKELGSSHPDSTDSFAQLDTWLLPGPVSVNTFLMPSFGAQKWLSNR